MPCEDAPCCGCCGTNIYGVRQDADEGPPYCDICGCSHFGVCPDDYDETDELLALEEDEGDNDPDYIQLLEDSRE